MSAYCNNGKHIWKIRGKKERAWCDDCHKYQKFLT